MPNEKIMFTGGGSAGHVSVNLTLIPRFLEMGWSVEYIGSEDGIEKQLISSISNVKYFGQNVKDPFKVFKGAVQAYRLIKKPEAECPVF